MDLHLFLGRPLKVIPTEGLDKDADWDGYLGRAGQGVIDEGAGAMKMWHEQCVDLSSMIRVYQSAYKQYKRSCPNPSQESIKRAKEIKLEQLGPQPVFVGEQAELEADRLNLLEEMKTYRPRNVRYDFPFGHAHDCHSLIDEFVLCLCI